MALAFEGFLLRARWASLGTRLVALRHPLLLAVGFGAAWSARDNADWGLLSSGARGLFGASPLGVYAHTPGLQAGPPSLAVVRVLNLLPGTLGIWAAHALLAFLGWLMLFLVERWTVAGVGWRQAPLGAGLRTLAVGVPVLLTWGSLAGGAPHLEDGLTIFTALLAVRAIAARRELCGALLIGLAIAWKPWGVAALPLVWGCSRRGRAMLVAIAVPAVCWLPFLVGDPATLSAVGHGFALQAGSPLRALGLSGTRVPDWWRSVQLLGALAAAYLAARRDWRSAFAAGCAMRLLLDPAGYEYYFAGLLMVTGLTELLAGKRPWRTAVLWFTVAFVPSLHPFGASYLVQFAGLVVVAAGWTQPWRKPATAPRAGILAPRLPQGNSGAPAEEARSPRDQVASFPSL